MYETRVTQVAVCPTGEPLYSEMLTAVEIATESGGEYVNVTQHGPGAAGKIAIMPEEWPTLRAAIDDMIGLCRSEQPAKED